eukprot:TRINITY_DN32_c0_g2_i1.p1 TRINITY_DN32_c0_g2~~TRINITY_DN32_c0_g2_i1.p1  ORF type:complete len:255 (+),score=56.65 TRINITY_DN32_c0_g2_i1:91-855(+)
MARYTGLLPIAAAAVALCMLMAMPAFTPSLLKSVNRVAGRGAAAQTRTSTQRCVDESGLVGTGPIVTLSKVLTDAATKMKEAVPVTQDVMMIKKKYEDEDIKEELLYILNNYATSELDKGHLIKELMGPYQSTVMPKFIVFLAKKKRLMSLRKVCTEYVQTLYFTQSIAPVKVTAADKLSEEQKNEIKDRMKARLGVQDVKLVVVVDGGLLAGFKVEWGYLDPEKLYCPSSSIDLSMKSHMNKMALAKGIVVQR